MSASKDRLAQLQSQTWAGSVPLEIRLTAADCRTYTDSDPYLIQHPRLSYLGFLLPRLHAFFTPALIDPEVPAHDAWLSFDGVPLKWHYPLGLLYDLYSSKEEGAWCLTIHYTDFPGEQLIQLDMDERTILDSFINAVKEADFIRNGSARTVMSLSKQDSDDLWRAVRDYDQQLYNTIQTKLLNPPGVEIRHVPIKVYLPTSASSTETIPEEVTAAGHIRVVQSLVPLQLPSRQPQTLGTALNSFLPTIFPSRRNPLLAQPVLHGAEVPMSANLGDLGRAAAYLDGFLHVAVVMLG